MSADLIRQINKNNEYVRNHKASLSIVETNAILRQFAANHKPSISFSQFPNQKAAMVVTCMDPRCNPNEFWNFSEEGPPVIRNGGGRVTEDALRSIRLLSGIMGFV